MAAAVPSGHPPADRSPYEDVRWLGVLRALAAHNMYHRSTGCSVNGPAVVQFLLQDPAFPRSVRHCTDQVDQLVAELPARPDLVTAVASLGRVVTRPATSSSDPAAVHSHVAEIQGALHRVHTAIAEAYFAGSSPQRAAATTGT